MRLAQLLAWVPNYIGKNYGALLADKKQTDAAILTS